jgi:hypothetical protein
MPNSTQLITDLHAIARSTFTEATMQRANQRLVGYATPSILIGVALARAAELKTALMELHGVIDPTDPVLALVNSILAILN